MNLEKRKEFIINASYLFIIGAIVLFVLRYGISYFVPFIYAWLISVLLNRPIEWISEKYKLPRNIVGYVLLFLFYAIIITFFVITGVRIVAFLTELFVELPSFYRINIEPYLQLFFKYIEDTLSRLDPSVLANLHDISLSLVATAGEWVSGISIKMVSWISSYVTSIPSLLVRLMFVMIASGFMVSDYHKIIEFVMRQFSEKTKAVIYDIKNYLIGTVLMCIKSYTLIMFITMIELIIGFFVLGIDNALTIALLTAICDILPILGVGTVLLPWAGINLLLGDFVLAIELAVLYIIITVLRNIIEPKIVGEKMGLHPLIALASLYVGAQLFGIIGLFGLPILLSLIKHLHDKGFIHWIK